MPPEQRLADDLAGALADQEHAEWEAVRLLKSASAVNGPWVAISNAVNARLSGHEPVEYFRGKIE